MVVYDDKVAQTRIGPTSNQYVLVSNKDFFESKTKLKSKARQQQRDSAIQAEAKIMVENNRPAWVAPSYKNNSSYICTDLQYTYLDSNATIQANHNKFIKDVAHLVVESAIVDMKIDQLFREYFFLVYRPMNINNPSFLSQLTGLGNK